MGKIRSWIDSLKRIPDDRLIKWLLWAALCSLVGPVLFHVWRFPWGFSGKTESWGHFGDFFGGVVGTLFVIIGSVFVYRSYVLQKNIAYQAGFETTLFKMIEFHHRLVDNLLPREGSFRGPQGAVQLRKIFDDCAEARKLLRPTFDIVRPLPIKAVREAYEAIHEREVHRLGHYFRHLYRIFLFIHESRLPLNEKQQYAKIVRAQLSPHEVVLLGLNGLCSYGDKFKPLIEEYALLHPRQNKEDFYLVFERCYKSSALGDHAK